MGGIRESIKNMLRVSTDEECIKDYAKQIYDKKFGNESGVWYEGYMIIDENNLEIIYGYGDMVNSFKHKIKE